MQAIVTKFLGPTNYRGSRVKASCDAGSLTFEWDHRLNNEENHHAAAVALAHKLGWTSSELASGSMPGSGYCHVFSQEQKLARLCREWASEGRNHGGNPEFYEFVKLADRILSRA